ncbi:MAG: toll/interleukin-1 receptor domain-containing protein [Alphaproteobacteria bacterium]
MTIQYACFVSYRRLSDLSTKAFIKQLECAIRNHLERLREDGVFIDYNDIRCGDELEEKVAQAICVSSCMVVVYCPAYDNSLYCRRELAAMIELENMRKQVIGDQLPAKRLIFTIVYGGSDSDIPQWIKDTIYIDMRKFSLLSKKIYLDKELDKKIREMVMSIWERHKIIDAASDKFTIDCTTFKLPPLEKAPSRSQPFPGR